MKKQSLFPIALAFRSRDSRKTVGYAKTRIQVALSVAHDLFGPDSVQFQRVKGVLQAISVSKSERFAYLVEEDVLDLASSMLALARLDSTSGVKCAEWESLPFSFINPVAWLSGSSGGSN